ncbi:type II secretion system protein GspL [Vibrio sp. SS-MA-C1-2]|uniref:type II secretion system protein GspL n=1 Tax=Vibrio sp. SS-MA-C1-2 TaxID=2908646 RepID=UPI001F179CB6|nr:type II secretion system protein GspL [Vibrio sp. SS-MA-C1-2]UJF19449.1 type II secretion system protein GspL [Vibrio sp. SS-MA-C1-2]
MSEFLTIRLNSRSEEKIQWIVWSTDQQEVIASGELSNSDELSLLTPYAQSRAVYILAPASDLLLTEVALPEGTARQINQVLPYLMEEDLAQDVDDLHFSVLQRQGDRVEVAIVANKLMERWLEELNAVDITPSAMIPDCLALPLIDGQSSALLMDEQWLIRRSTFIGASVEGSWLGSWLSSELAEQLTNKLKPSSETQLATDVDQALDDDQSAKPWLIHSFSSQLTEQVAEFDSIECREQPAELPMAILAQSLAGSSLKNHGLNLLTGRYKPQSEWRTHFKPWRKALIALGVLFAVMAGDRLLTLNELEAQAASYRQQSEALFHQVLPNKKRIPTASYLRSQLKGELAKLDGGSKSSGLLAELDRLQPVLQKNPQFQIQNLKWDDNRAELRVLMQADNFQRFEKLKSELSEISSVNLGQLNRNNEGLVVGTFILTNGGE